MTFSIKVLLLLLHFTQGLVGIVLEGSDTSYAQYYQWHGGPNSTIELEFQTTQSDALILYTDNVAKGEYLQLTLVNGALRLRFNWGGGRSGMLTVGQNLNSVDTWHSVVILRIGPETSLIVDRLYRASTGSNVKTSHVLKTEKALSDMLDASIFGNASSNSYVFVGGLPSFFGMSGTGPNAKRVALPLVLLEPRLKGKVRGLKYRDIVHRTETPQKMMAYKVCILMFVFVYMIIK